MANLCRGRLVWIELAGLDGQTKRRPVVVTTPDAEIDTAAELAGIACSHSAAATVVVAIAQRQRLDDEAQRLSYHTAFDLVAYLAGAVALVLAVVAARRETSRVRTLALAVALVANVWNLIVV